MSPNKKGNFIMEQLELLEEGYVDYEIEWSPPWCCNLPEEQPADCFNYYGLVEKKGVICRHYLYTVRWSNT